MMPNALEMARQVRDGSRSAASILEETVARISAGDAALNCFTCLSVDRARAEAAAIDARRSRGEALPVLAGVPYAVKNLYDIAGIVTLAGGKVNAANAAAARDAALIARMSEAGALLLGALNMDEHAYGFTTENTHYGVTRNPHDCDRIAGGSSGGSAAAVAAGFVPLSLGSDTNGSIRVPASLCGIFGLKPTYGRLSRAGTFPFVASLDHLGPFANNAADLAAIYDVLQGPDANDPACAQRQIEPAAAGQLPDASRMAVLGGYFEAWASEPARRAVRLVADALGARGRSEFASAEQARAAAFIITAAEGGALHRQRLLHSYEAYEPLSRDRLVAGSLIPASWVLHAQRLRQRIRQEVMQLFEHHDLLIAPATPVEAMPIGTEWLNLNGQTLPARASMGLLTQPISFLGLPVCTVPLWPIAGGLPIGVQLIAPPWREDICLAAARVLEVAGVAYAQEPA